MAGNGLHYTCKLAGKKYFIAHHVHCVPICLSLTSLCLFLLLPPSGEIPAAPSRLCRDGLYYGICVGSQWRCITRHALRELGNQVAVIFFRACVFFVITLIVVELDHIVRDTRTSTPRKGSDHTT